jgi:hypothetical protein
MRAPPKWVPRAVRAVAVRARYGDREVRRRLINDPRMEQIWATLAVEGRRRARELEYQRRFPEDPLAHILAERLRMDTWGVTRWVPVVDRLCAAFYLAAVFAFAPKRPVNFPKTTVKASDFEKEVKRWRTGANLCREALCSPNWPPPLDPEVAAALEASAAFLEEQANFIEACGRGNPYAIGRSSRRRAPGGSKDKPGDDAVRGPTRVLALATEEIFGRPMRKIVATTASTASGVPVSAKAVENWTPFPTKRAS